MEFNDATARVSFYNGKCTVLYMGGTFNNVTLGEDAEIASRVLASGNGYQDVRISGKQVKDDIFIDKILLC